MSMLSEAEVRRFHGLSSYGLIREAGSQPPMPGAPQDDNASGLQPGPGEDMPDDGGLPSDQGATAPQNGAPQGGPEGLPSDGAGDSPEGFAPQGADSQPMIGGPNDTPQENEVQSDDEVIDVDELTDSQEDTEKKVDKLASKLETIIKAIGSFKDQIDKSNARIDKVADDIKASIELHNPTPVQKMALRAKDGYPFKESPDHYWNEKTKENPNYSTEEEVPEPEQYTITKADVDGINDFNSIARSFDGVTLNSSLNL